MWQSMIGTREFILQGLRWRVGNDAKIKIWQDKWLNIPNAFLVHSPNNLLHYDARVKDLIIEEEGKWKVRLLNELFWEEEVAVIQQIPSSKYGR